MYFFKNEIILFQNGGTHPSWKLSHFSIPFSPSFWAQFKLHILFVCVCSAPKIWLFSLSHAPNVELSTMPNSSKLSKAPKFSKCTRKSGKTPESMTSSNSTYGHDGTSSGKQGFRAHWVHWNAARTEQLLDWLDKNPKECQKLFSDSSKDAKDEGWWKCVAKSMKLEYHKMIVAYIFPVDSDPKVRANFHANPGCCNSLLIAGSGHTCNKDTGSEGDTLEGYWQWGCKCVQSREGRGGAIMQCWAKAELYDVKQWNRDAEQWRRISPVDSLGTVPYIWVCLYTVPMDLRTDHGLCVVYH